MVGTLLVSSERWNLQRRSLKVFRPRELLLKLTQTPGGFGLGRSCRLCPGACPLTSDETQPTLGGADRLPQKQGCEGASFTPTPLSYHPHCARLIQTLQLCPIERQATSLSFMLLVSHQATKKLPQGKSLLSLFPLSFPLTCARSEVGGDPPANCFGD